MDLKANDYLFQGSPFSPDVEPQVVEHIRADLRDDPTYYPGEAIAKHLVLVGIETAAKLMGRRINIGRAKVLMGPNEVSEYSQGFAAPICLLQFSYISVAHGLAAARWALANHPPGVAGGNALQDLLTSNLEYAARLLAEDISGKRLVEDFVRRESQRSSDLYRNVGLEAARRAFTAYCDTLGVD